MTDAELRDRLASEYSPSVHSPWADEGNDYEAFKTGWDFARANPLRDEKRLWDDCERLRKERDRLLEVNKVLREALKWVEQSVLESVSERNLMVYEKVQDALNKAEELSKPHQFGPDISQDGEIWDDFRGEKK